MGKTQKRWMGILAGAAIVAIIIVTIGMLKGKGGGGMIPTTQGDVQIKDVTVNYMTEPLGVEVDSISFAWKMDSKIAGMEQKAYKIEVIDPEKNIVWDSGKVETSNSVGIAYEGPKLSMATCYQVKVSVWAKDGKVYEASNTSFETGVSEDETWKKTPWIALNTKTSVPPIFRTEHVLKSKEVSTARLYITAIGVYKAYLNGSVVGETDHMTPGYGDGNRSISYQTYDVTNLIKERELALAVVTGTGWMDENGNDVMGGTENRVGVKALLVVTYEDGSKEQMGTDENTWKASLKGGIVKSGIFHGEDFDANLEKQLGNYKEYGYTYDDSWIDVNGCKEEGTDTKTYVIGNEFEAITTKYLRISVFKTGPAVSEDRENRLQIMELEGYNRSGENVLSGKIASISNADELPQYGWSAKNLTDGDTGEQSGRGYTSTILGTNALETFELQNPITITFEFEEAVDLTKIQMYARTGKGSVVDSVCPNYPKEYSIQVSDDGVEWNSIVDHFDSGVVTTGSNSAVGKKLTTLQYSGAVIADPASVGKYAEAFHKTPESIVIYRGEASESEFVGGEIHVLQSYKRERAEENICGTGVVLKAGETMIVDFGQNMTAVPRILMQGEAGKKVTLRFGEMLNDGSKVTEQFVSGTHDASGPKGSLYTHSNRNGRSAATYVFSGEEKEEYQTLTSFFGYQYMEVTAECDITIFEMESKAVSSLTEQTGWIETNNADVNRLFLNALYGQMSNYFTMITDCPQRDERKGWTGDAQVFTQTGLYNFNSLAFHESYQNKLRAAVASKGYAPAVLSLWDYFGNWASGWSDVTIINVYLMYRQTGDISLIQDNWNCMNQYMDYLKSHERSPYQGPNQDTTGYGDWLAFQGTGYEVIADYNYGYVTKLMAELAEVLGDEDKKIYYEERLKQLKETFLATHVTYENGELVIHSARGSRVMQNKGGVLEDNSQTALLWMLKLGYYENEAMAEEALRLLIDNIRNTNPKEDSIRAQYGENSLAVGFIGVNVIAPVLTEAGYSDVAYDLLLNTECPSWLYEVKQGATTIWERWNSYHHEDGFGDSEMNSFNHFSYGSVVEWMYRYMAGIATDVSKPGFQHMILQPTIDTGSVYNEEERINHVRGVYESFYGTIESEWFSEEGKLTEYSVTLPANTTATLYLPVEGEFAQDGIDAELVSFEGVETWNGAKRMKFTLKSGSYHFTVNETTVEIHMP